ncbi:MAG: hypothetical protein JW725_04125 [Candidatus Babeliaceae bacterium]|nr:hypothetical protein [Candidatus Babeliaceae bacterium]
MRKNSRRAPLLALVLLSGAIAHSAHANETLWENLAKGSLWLAGSGALYWSIDQGIRYLYHPLFGPNIAEKKGALGHQFEERFDNKLNRYLVKKNFSSEEAKLLVNSIDKDIKKSFCSKVTIYPPYWLASGVLGKIFGYGSCREEGWAHAQHLFINLARAAIPSLYTLATLYAYHRLAKPFDPLTAWMILGAVPCLKAARAIIHDPERALVMSGARLLFGYREGEQRNSSSFTRRRINELLDWDSSSATIFSALGWTVGALVLATPQVHRTMTSKFLSYLWSSQ